MKVIFIRHGESTSNAGIITHDVTHIELTEKGHQQANNLANEWKITPDLIGISPFLRTQQTAQPTILRFPNCPVKILPMEEFTYLEPSRWNGTQRSERLPHIESYWQRSDPNYQDGPQAESFMMLLKRIDQTLLLLANVPTSREATIFAFSHGQFMQALKISLLHPDWSAQQKMCYFWDFNQAHPIHNIHQIMIKKTDQRWQVNE